MFNETDAGPWESFHEHMEPCRRCGEPADWWLCEDCETELSNAEPFDFELYQAYTEE